MYARVRAAKRVWCCAARKSLLADAYTSPPTPDTADRHAYATCVVPDGADTVYSTLHCIADQVAKRSVARDDTENRRDDCFDTRRRRDGGLAGFCKLVGLTLSFGALFIGLSVLVQGVVQDGDVWSVFG
jgi:hypothetical protein